MTTLVQRVLTAIVLVGMLVGVLFFLPPVAARIFFGLALLMAAWEWSGLISRESLLIRIVYVGVLVLLAGLLAWHLSGGFTLDSCAWLGLIWWLIVAGWLLSGGAVLSLRVVVLAGIFGLIPAWYAILRLLGAEDGAWLLVWCAAIVAAADTGAYFIGRAIGRTKLAPAVSPGKTREGLYGGVACAALVGAAGAGFFGRSPLLFAGAGAVIALVSVAGDLLVSACKRRAGIKDSGWILPGHGGVLDRIDGLHAALPLFMLVAAGFGLLGQDFTSSR